ncbi:hypothetical protein [Mammaliicoccus vitulinus]|nr:hypothetical protein [Mammaliicoccus vitulinus]
MLNEKQEVIKEKLEDIEFLLEWSITKLAFTFELDPQDVKRGDSNA